MIARNPSFNHSAAHSALVRKILVTFGADKRCRLMQQRTGKAWQGPRLISFGQRGSPDVLGILRGGRCIGIEVKTGSAVLTPEQKNWRRVFEEWGGLFVEARRVEDVAIALASVVR